MTNRQFVLRVATTLLAVSLAAGAQTTQPASPAPAASSATSVSTAPLASATTTAAGAAQFSRPAAQALRIGAGDLLQIAVFDTPELSCQQRVNEKGAIQIPVGGALVVSGMTADEAAKAIENRLRERQIVLDPHVSVNVAEYATQGVKVMGEVKNPGIYPLLGAQGLMDMISAAGGTTPTAGKVVTIVHSNDVEHPQVLRLGSTPQTAGQDNVALQPGDTVTVARSGVVYVIGEVNRPGGFLIDTNERIGAMEAIALAEGTNKTASLDKARILRKNLASDERTEISAPLKSIMAGKAKDVALQDGDILVVPSSASKNAAYRGIESALAIVTGAAIYQVGH